jgi:hypothetical protein
MNRNPACIRLKRTLLGNLLEGTAAAKVEQRSLLRTVAMSFEV